ncbi:hypothetical protein [Yokenella regensburgei]
MTLAVLFWMATVVAVMWLICGVATLLAGGFLWPLGKSDED